MRWPIAATHELLKTFKSHAPRQLARRRSIENRRNRSHELLALHEASSHKERALALKQPLLVVRLRYPEEVRLLYGGPNPGPRGDGPLSSDHLVFIVGEDDRSILPRATGRHRVVTAKKRVEDSLI